MAKRSHQDWAALIQQQPASGLTITDFCRLHRVSTSTFYALKASIAKANSANSFVKAQIAAPASVTTHAQFDVAQPTITLQHQTLCWTFPSTLPASYLLEIIKGLQAC